MGTPVAKTIYYGAAPRAYIVGSYPQHFEKVVYIIELRYGVGLTVKEIAKYLQLPERSIRKTLEHYRPRRGTKDITMTIMSAV